MNKNRNHFVDIMRGVAMLLVVLGHTMNGCTIGADKTFLFNFIWSLQMPLFILISGYVTKYSRGISDAASLWRYMKRRTLAYMLPWIVWSFAVRGWLFGQHDFFNLGYLFWHMDAGYWFLATIWTISMIFGVASYVAERIIPEAGFKNQLITLGVYIAGMVVLGGIGLKLGLSFFAIKLTLYYMPFYFAGYLYGQYDSCLMKWKQGKSLRDLVVAVCSVCWLFIILRYSLYDMSDSGVAILVRAATSLAGCIAICGLSNTLFPEKIGGGNELCRNVFPGNLPQPLSVTEPVAMERSITYNRLDGNAHDSFELRSNTISGSVAHNLYKDQPNSKLFPVWTKGIKSFFLWAGEKSLEIYMIHGLLLNLLMKQSQWNAISLEGKFLIAGNYGVTIFLCYVCITLIEQNRILEKLLYTK